MSHNVESITQQFQDFLSTPEGIPPADLFEPFKAEQFEEQAGREVAPFFEANLANALKQLDLAETQQRESKELVERQEGETFADFKGIADRGFAKALGRASGRFAGRGIATSGARRGALDEFFQEKEDTLSGAERGVRQAGETRELGFTQFLGRTGLEREEVKLGTERDKRAEQARVQQQLFAEAVTGRQQAQGAFGDRFARFLGEEVGA